MSVGKIRQSFQTAQTQKPNDVITSKEIKAIVTEARKDDHCFEPAEKAEIAALAADAIANNKMNASAQKAFAKLQTQFGIHETRPQPAWMGNLSTVIERSGQESRPLHGSTITYDNWARQRAAVRELRFEMWEPGVTDRDDPDLWKKYEAKVHFRFAGETQFHEAHIDFKKRSGNNAVLAMSLEKFDPWFAKYNNQSEVKNITPKLDESSPPKTVAKLEVFFTVNGKRLGAGAGPNDNFHVNYENSGPIS